MSHVCRPLHGSMASSFFSLVSPWRSALETPTRDPVLRVPRVRTGLRCSARSRHHGSERGGWKHRHATWLPKRSNGIEPGFVLIPVETGGDRWNRASDWSVGGRWDAKWVWSLDEFRASAEATTLTQCIVILRGWSS